MVNNSLHIFLDTRDKVYGSASNCQFTLSNTNLVGGKYSLCLQSAIIPNLEYNINSSNNKLYLSENGGGTIIISLEIQNYTAVELAVELQTAMNNAGSLTYSVSYLTKPKKFLFSVSLPDTFQILEGPLSVNNNIGFLTNSDIGTAIESDVPVRLDGCEYVDLTISGLTHNYNISSRRENYMVARIPILEQFGGIVYFLEPDTHNYIEVDNDLFYRFQINLTKPDGTNFNLPDNAHISYVFRCERL